MSIHNVATNDTSRDELLQELIEEGLQRSEIQGALHEIRLSSRELRRELDVRLVTHEDDIWASAEPERQEVQRIESEAETRAADIDAYNQLHRRKMWSEHWKRYAFLAICIAVASGLARARITAFSIADTGFAALALLLLILLVVFIILDRYRLQRERLRRHQELADDLDAVRKSYSDALLDRGVLPFIRQVMNDPNIQKEYYGVRLNIRRAPGLQGDDKDFIIETASSMRLIEKLDAMPSGGNFGIAGPRGSGKTSVLNAICNGHRLAIQRGENTPRGKPFRVLVSAPVEFSSREFLLHLFSEICRTYIRDFTKLSEGPGVPTVESKLRGPIERRSGRLSVLFFIGSIIVLAFAITPTMWRQFWQNYMVPNLAKQYGSQWGHTKRNWAKVWLFVGRLDLRTVAIGLILLTISFVFLWMSFRRLASQTSAQRQNALRSRDLGWKAKEMLQRIKFQQSYSSGWSGTLKLPIVEGGVNEAINMAENQMSLPDIVAEIKEFLSRIAKAHRVILAVDELDKVDSDVKAGQFLNDLKGIFYVPECFYLVSVSEEALSNFELRGLPFRDAFDSAFDEVAHFRYLVYPESRLLLERRVVGLPAAYLCLCHCVAGGLPRDLIRVARELALLRRRHAKDEDPGDPLVESATLARITSDLVRADLEDRIAATVIALHRTSGLEVDELAAWIDGVRTRVLLGDIVVPGDLMALCASYPTTIDADSGLSSPREADVRVRRLGLGILGSLYYSATLLELFTDDRHETEIRVMEGNGDGSAEQLALARQAFTSSALLAWPRISRFRRTWNMEVLEFPIRGPAPQAKQLRHRGKSRQPGAPAAAVPIVPRYTSDGDQKDGSPFAD
jgi:hypothetical protein